MRTLLARPLGATIVTLSVFAALGGCASQQMAASDSGVGSATAGTEPLQVYHVTPHHEQEDRLLIALHSLDAKDRQVFGALVGEEGVAAQVLIDDPRLNPRLSARRVYTLVTMTGAHALGPVEAVYLARGAGEDHIHHVVSRPKEAVLDPLALAVVTSGPLPADLLLREPSHLDLGHARWGDGLRHAQAAVAEAAAHFDGRGLARELAPEEDVRVTPGRFGGARAFAVLVTVPLRDEGSDDDYFEEGLDGYLSLLLFMDAEGRLVGTSPELTSFNHVAINALGDLDGDGVDEIIYVSSYFEGMYIYLLQRRGDAAVTTLLAGDGA